MSLLRALVEILISLFNFIVISLRIKFVVTEIITIIYIGFLMPISFTHSFLNSFLKSKKNFRSCFLNAFFSL